MYYQLNFVRYNHYLDIADQLHILPGEEFEILVLCDDQGWVTGRNVITNTEGVFPASYVSLHPNDDIDGSGESSVNLEGTRDSMYRGGGDDA